jgi:protein-disulfide isomerase
VTPTVIVNGKKFTGVGQSDVLMELIEEALRESGRR